ncbi:hypothetical protein MSHOH_2470 [Methanosarcina horonobensis HB-1 = JCM 15518]|uniref:Uncharacterized protein n=1 Tax=Methanosarcina horonobensis HB-1 = JCM 15518 TaxID=1434110 RepID=A0A0E3SH12_9EURY|nr:hypothetical protein [Methanosarcina horonobensis]AKB78953.1 hypothetical protein MSHOH_2470 [Methanosarcina horonobensis HB-1 = JCM 15518]
MIMNEHKTLWEKYFLNFRNVASPLRKPALFDWLYNSYRCLYLSCVDPSLVSRLTDLKTCLSMIGVAVDDSCDYALLREKNGGDKFSYEILSMLYNTDKIESGDYILLDAHLTNNMYIKTTIGIYSDLVRNQIASLPRYCDFRGEFLLAMRNVAESMEFSYLLNKNKIVYPFSHVVRSRAASTMIETHSLLDLMSSKNFDTSELGKAIVLFKLADIVAMLSNTINTWTREITERDYSCPVISLALEKKLIKFSDFERASTENLKEKLSPVSEVIEDELDKAILSMKEFAENSEIKSFDTSKFVNNYVNLYWQTDAMN